MNSTVISTWWRHQMGTFSALLAICAGNPQVNSPHKGQWRGTLMFSLICAWISSWVNNREAGDLRCYCAHYDINVMNAFESNRHITIKVNNYITTCTHCCWVNSLASSGIQRKSSWLSVILNKWRNALQLDPSAQYSCYINTCVLFTRSVIFGLSLVTFAARVLCRDI